MMPHVTVGKEHASPIELSYEDHGSGKPIVLIHGWPLSSRSWEKQVPALIAAGHRVVTYDRRGFGQSSRPASGYDYATLTDDLRSLLIALDLHDVALVGFSMGGGEVARYCGQFGDERVRQAIFVSAVTPFLRKSADNPDGVDPVVFDGIVAAARADRPAFLATFLRSFFNADSTARERISDPAIQAHWNEAVAASPIATTELVGAWSGTDFRPDLARIDIPTLIVHGEADQTVPFALSAARTHTAIAGSQLVAIPDAPHGLNWTHADELNSAIIDFLAGKADATKSRPLLGARSR